MVRVYLAAVVAVVAVGCADGDNRTTDDGRATSTTTPAGDAAVWSVDESEPPTPAATGFTALVTRLGCNSGVTGRTFGPSIMLSATRIVVTFSVEPGASEAECPSNDEVPHAVDIGEPIGRRQLVDGTCLPGGEAATTSHCIDGATRWTP